MTTITALIRRHPLPAYYTLTFAISWGGMLMVIGGPGGLPGTPEQADRLMGIAFSLMAGPSVSGLLLTGLVSRRDGPARPARAVASVAGGRSLVRRRAPDRTAPIDGGVSRAVA